MGNLDFANSAEFSWYCVLLVISGLTVIVLSRSRGKSRYGLTLNLVLGVAFLCYGDYLIFGFRGDHYFIPYWVLILPVVLLTRTNRSSNGDKARRPEETK